MYIMGDRERERERDIYIYILRAAAPAADPGRMVMWLYDSYIIYQMMV